MLKQTRTTLLGKGLMIAILAGIGAWTTGCFHGHDDDEHRSQPAGWHDRGGYDRGGYDRGYDNGYNGGRDYNHEYR
jgi:hypothetical protein